MSTLYQTQQYNTCLISGIECYTPFIESENKQVLYSQLKQPNENKRGQSNIKLLALMEIKCYSGPVYVTGNLFSIENG